jgi:hypothetical protein
LKNEYLNGKKEVNMSELTEKQKYYARYLAKLPVAQRNGMLANIKPSFRALLRNHIESELIVKNQSLSAQQIEQLEPKVKKMYLARLKKESPMKYEFLQPMVLMGGRIAGKTTLINEARKLEKAEC